MSPRQLAVQKPAKAPPKPDSSKSRKTFGRFKEKRFCRAIELTKHFMDRRKRWGVIVGSEEVKTRLESEGIKDVVFNPKVVNPNEIILNRGKDSKESNFFVFIKFNAFKTTAMYTDPTSGREGRALKREQIVRIRSAWRDKEGWAREVAREAKEVAEKKARNKFFAVMHGHWGENIDDGVHRDDGVSKRKDIIRQFMRWHYDIDATGYHNWIHETALRDITGREKDVGILKVPSMEVTIPFDPRGRNGPHFNWWFNGIKSAIETCRKLIWKRGQNNRLPGLAPEVDKRTVLREITLLKKKGEVAVGVAHPSCILNLLVKRLPVGLLNLLSHKDEHGEYLYNWKAIKSVVKKYADGVGEYNPTLVDYVLRFDDKKTEAYFRRKVDELVADHMDGKSEVLEEDETKKIMLRVDAQMRPDADMRENSVSYAFAQRMKEKYGTFTYFDHDSHVYTKTNFYDRSIGPLAYGRTVFTLNNDGFNEEITAGNFVRMLSDESYRAKNVLIATETFLELHNGRFVPVKPRRDLLYKIKTAKDVVRQGVLYARLGLLEARKTLGRLMR